LQRFLPLLPYGFQLTCVLERLEFEAIALLTTSSSHCRGGKEGQGKPFFSPSSSQLGYFSLTGINEVNY